MMKFNDFYPPSPISIIQPALVRLSSLSWPVTGYKSKRDILKIQC
jgi:hypothetical protein